MIFTENGNTNYKHKADGTNETEAGRNIIFGTEINRENC